MRKIFVLSAAAAVLSACHPIAPENPAVMTGVIATPNPPPKQCKYITQVLGSQGNAFTGGFTSNANMEIGSMNDLKNKAYRAGGNYVQIVTNRAGVTGGSYFHSNGDGGFMGGGSTEQTNVTSTGNVYRCPPASIGLS